MAEQRQPFRFRLPWLPAPAAPRPSPTPTPAQPAPTPSATAAPILRPPFRPPGIVQVQPPPPPPPPPPPQDQAQAAPRTESEVQSPPLAAVRSPPLAAARSPPFVAARSPPFAAARSPPFAAARSPPFAAARSPPLAAARSPVTSQPTSPTRAEYQFLTGSVPSSPSRGPSQYAGPTSSQPTSPSRTATRVPPTSQVVSQPASPSRRLQSSFQESSQAPPTYRRPQTLATGPEEMKPAVSQMWSQEPQTKAQITTETPKSQDQNILGTTVVVAAPKAPAPPQKSDSSTLIDDAKPVGEYDQISKASQVDTQEPQSKAEIPSWTLPTSRVVAQPSQAPGPVAAALPTSAAIETPSGPQKPDSFAVTSVWKPFSSEPRSEETEERKKVEQELIKEEKTDGPAYETPKQGAEAEIHTISPHSKIQIKEQQTVTFPGGQKQPGKREILDRKEILLTSGSSGKQSEVVISTHPKDRSPVSEPRPKPATFNGERAPLHKEIREDISKIVHKLTTGHPKQPMDEKPISITSLVGENRGASMHFVPESAKKDASLHIHRGYKANTDEGGVENIEGEGSSREDSMIKEVEATKAYINSNVQSINNSIFCDAAVTERNPGVQLDISCTPTAQAKFGCKEEPLEAHKAEFSVTPSQKLTYEPVIKRRCLRGLFLESSDSDPDNPEKPKRHGCRYSSGEKSKGNNTDV